ncbi:MAG: triose-phosphate isomerase [bacterium]|nr:triose-phosphate isomerase [bacterium]
MAKKLVIGNWKMNPSGVAQAVRLIRAIGKGVRRYKKAEVAVALPHAFLHLKLPSSLRKGAQDLFYGKGGAFTGEVSGGMVKNLGARYVLVGHSERRALGDTEEIVNRKMRAAIAAGLVPVLCVGETARDGESHYLHRVKEELKSALKRLSRAALARVVVAYEPVWAIGEKAKGALPPEEALHMNLFIRKAFSDVAGEQAARKLKVLYGGSVTPANAGAFLAEGKMDGILVGRESLDSKRFLAIVRAAHLAR